MKVIEYDVYDSFNRNGSSRQGYINAKYDDLLELFKPSYVDADPYVRFLEWVLNASLMISLRMKILIL